MHSAVSGRSAWARAALLALLAAGVVLGSAPRGESAHPGGNGMIAYSSAQSGSGPLGIDRQVFTVNPDGTGTALVLDNALAGEWSPDGSKLIYRRVIASGIIDLYVVNADGTGERRLTSGISALSPSWSPDGTKIAYKHASLSNSVSGEIWVMNPDGTGKTQVTSDGYAKRDLDWGMTPGGPKIAYFGSLPSFSWSLITINPDGTGRTRMPGVPSTLAPRADEPDWSPDGTKILFSSYTSSVSGSPLGCNVNVVPNDVYVYDTVTNAVENLTSTPSWEGPHEYAPVWSPDGTRVAMQMSFQQCIDGRREFVRPAIYTMPATGGETFKVTVPPVYGDVHANHVGPQWQPCVAATPKCASVRPPPRLVSVSVSPQGAAVQVGGLQQFTATARYSDSSTDDVTDSVTWASTSPAVATIDAGGRAVAVGGGSTTIRATLGSVSGSTSLSVTKKSQTIAFAALPNRTFGDADFTVSATASSGLPVSFTASGSCTIAGATIRLTAAGSCTIRASQAGDSTYYAAPSVSRSFTIAQRPGGTTPQPQLPKAGGGSCKVPRVVGMRLVAAKRALAARRCRTGRVRYALSARYKRGIVAAQSRRVGQVVPAGTKVNLTVSR